MTYEIAESRYVVDEWRVEGIDIKTGEVHVTIFSGPQSRQRAADYLRWIDPTS